MADVKELMTLARAWADAAYARGHGGVASADADELTEVRAEEAFELALRRALDALGVGEAGEVKPDAKNIPGNIPETVSLDEVQKLAEKMWRGESVPGRVLRFGAAVLGLADAAASGMEKRDA